MLRGGRRPGLAAPRPGSDRACMAWSREGGCEGEEWKCEKGTLTITPSSTTISDHQTHGGHAQPHDARHLSRSCVRVLCFHNTWLSLRPPLRPSFSTAASTAAHTASPAPPPPPPLPPLLKTSPRSSTHLNHDRQCGSDTRVWRAPTTISPRRARVRATFRRRASARKPTRPAGFDRTALNRMTRPPCGPRPRPGPGSRRRLGPAAGPVPGRRME